MSALSEDEPEDLKRDRKASERRCIVTRSVQPKEKLLRFVAGPDGVITPDLAAKLPGRGCWVMAQRNCVEKAAVQNAYAKSLKRHVTVPADLSGRVEALLERRALERLGLAKKAGNLLQGFDKIEAALMSDRVIALVHATSASPESMKKLAISALPRFCCFQNAALSATLGSENAVHVALLNGQAGQAALKEIRRFTGFLEISDV